MALFVFDLVSVDDVFDFFDLKTRVFQVSFVLVNQRSQRIDFEVKLVKQETHQLFNDVSVVDDPRRRGLLVAAFIEVTWALHVDVKFIIFFVDRSKHLLKLSLGGTTGQEFLVFSFRCF